MTAELDYDDNGEGTEVNGTHDTAVYAMHTYDARNKLWKPVACPEGTIRKTFLGVTRTFFRD